MARMLSIHFDFIQQQYTSLVSLCSTNDGLMSFTVASTDDHLSHLLPGGKLKSINLEEIKASSHSAKFHELVFSLESAVQQKLYTDKINENASGT